MIIKLLVDGGEMKPGPVVAQKIGPLGMNMGKIIQEINQATSEFRGIKVPVALDIDTKTKTFKIEVSSPPTSELLKKEVGLEKGSGDHKKNKVANISIEQVIKIAKIKHPNMLAKEFKSAVKSVIGSCVSLGILVENKNGNEIQEDINNKVYDKEIKEQKTEVSEEKKIKLKTFFEGILKAQEEAKKVEEAAKAAEEAAKAVAAGTTAAGTAAPGATTPETTSTVAKPGEEKKAEEKPAAKGKEEKAEKKK